MIGCNLRTFTAKYTPWRESGCVLALLWDRGITVDSNGKVTSWSDVVTGSGITLGQGASGSSPSLAVDSVHFDAADSLTGVFSRAQPCTVFSVAKPDSAVGKVMYWAGGGGPIYGRNGGYEMLLSDFGASNFGVETAPATLTCAVCDGGSSALYGADPNTTLVSGALSSVAMTVIESGFASGTSESTIGHKQRALIIYAGAKDAATRGRVLTWLSQYNSWS